MKDCNYYRITSKSGKIFDIHCASLTIHNSGDIELYQIWVDVGLIINIKDIEIINQINPLDAGMEFVCYNDLIRAFTENNIEFEVIVDLYELT